MKNSQDEKSFLVRIQETSEEKALYLVAEEDGQILGHIFLKFYGKKTAPFYPDIEDAFVREDLRGKGIGTKLIDEVKRRQGKKDLSKLA